MNFQTLIAVLAVLSTACPAVRAQDHLEPEDGILEMNEREWDYTKRLRAILLKDADYYHLARMVYLPSFAPESVVTVIKRNDAQLTYFVEYAEAERSLWGRGPFGDVKVKKSRASIDRQTAETVQEVWRLMLRTVRYPDKDRHGLDGTTYRFSRGVPLLDQGRPPTLEGGFEHGQVWSPNDGSMTGELVGIGASLKRYALAKPEEKGKLRSEILATVNRLKAKLDPPHHSK